MDFKVEIYLFIIVIFLLKLLNSEQITSLDPTPNRRKTTKKKKKQKKKTADTMFWEKDPKCNARVTNQISCY